MRIMSAHNKDGHGAISDEALRYYYAELGKACERIAGHGLQLTPLKEDALRWALSLANKNLDNFSEGQWNDCRYEVDSFARVGPFEWGKSPQTPVTAANWPLSPDPTECIAQPGIRQTEIERLPSKAIVKQLKEDISEVLDGIIRDENIERPLPLGSKERLVIIRESVNGKTVKRAFRYLVLPNLSSVFTHYLFLVLEHSGAALRRCLGCKQRFLADRSDKEYCNSKCRNLYVMRGKRNVPSERYWKRGRPSHKLQAPELEAGAATTTQHKNRPSVHSKKKQKAVHIGGKRRGKKK